MLNFLVNVGVTEQAVSNMKNVPPTPAQREFLLEILGDFVIPVKQAGVPLQKHLAACWENMFQRRNMRNVHVKIVLYWKFQN